MKEKLYNLYVTKEMSISEVAKELGVGSSTAFRWLKKWGIPRRKNGAHQKGVPSGALGKHWKLSEETKKKISEARKGMKFTKEHRENMSKVRKGKKSGMEGKRHSKESKKKMGEAKKGSKHPNYGKHLPKETRKKIGKAHKGKNHWNYGGHPSKETREKMSEAHTGEKHPLYGKSHSVESKQKMSKAKRGEKAPNWKGGITPKNKKIREGIEYRLWREAVFARDNWVCQKTGQKGGELQAHHIQDFSTNPDSRTSIENGITLSKEAHQEFHKIYGRNNNTKEQLEEYLS